MFRVVDGAPSRCPKARVHDLPTGQLFKGRMGTGPAVRLSVYIRTDAGVVQLPSGEFLSSWTHTDIYDYTPLDGILAVETSRER